jgi:hypothetical protein
MFDRERIRDGASTRRHAIFKPGAKTVMFDAGAPPVIGEGDRFAVAGRKLLAGG